MSTGASVKHLTPSNLTRCQNVIFTKLNRTVAEGFVNWVINNSTSENHLYGGYSWSDGAWLFLFWITKSPHPSYREIHEAFGLAKSNCRQVFGSLRRIAKKWAKQQFGEQTADERLRIAASWCTEPTLQNLTLLLDGIVFQVQKSREKEEREEQPSKKLKCKNIPSKLNFEDKPGRNFIVAITLDRRITFCN